MKSISIATILAGQRASLLPPSRYLAMQKVNKGKSCWINIKVAGTELLGPLERRVDCEIRNELYLRKWANSPTFGT